MRGKFYALIFDSWSVNLVYIILRHYISLVQYYKNDLFTVIITFYLNEKYFSYTHK